MGGAGSRKHWAALHSYVKGKVMTVTAVTLKRSNTPKLKRSAQPIAELLRECSDDTKAVMIAAALIDYVSNGFSDSDHVDELVAADAAAHRDMLTEISQSFGRAPSLGALLRGRDALLGIIAQCLDHYALVEEQLAEDDEHKAMDYVYETWTQACVGGRSHADLPLS